MDELIRLAFSCQLEAPPSTVWNVVATVRGVNDELRPLVRMTAPAGCEDFTVDHPALRNGLASWQLLLGFIPIDRHRIEFESIVVGEAFSESSTSWMNSTWRHTRKVTAGPRPATSILYDAVDVQPKVRLMEPMFRMSLQATFARRYRRLYRRFGEAR